MSLLAVSARAQFYAPETEYHDPVQRMFPVEAARVLAWRANQLTNRIAEVSYTVSTSTNGTTAWRLSRLDKDGKPVKVTYDSSQLSTQSDQVKNEVEPAFVNDNYWLLFPFHAYWDKSATVTDEGMKKLPVGSGSAELVVVKYPAEAGGYTPGDTWELYVGKDKRVECMVYHRGGAKPPSLVIAPWAGYKKAGPLLVSTEHRGTADGKPLHIFISDVAVKVTGSAAWMKAQ